MAEPAGTFVDKKTLEFALRDLRGTADHLLKIWFTLKHMGMRAGHAVSIDTANSTPSLKALFACGDPSGRFYVPFAHTERYMTMAPDASRSIIQTTIRRWLTSGSVVTIDPTTYLSISEEAEGTLQVRPSRSYPEGLGYGRNGFALVEETRLAMPLRAFAIWYYRQEPLPDADDLGGALIQRLTDDLNLSIAERDLVFSDDRERSISTSRTCLSDSEVFAVTQAAIAGDGSSSQVVQQSYDNYVLEVRSMSTPTFGRPEWLAGDPGELLQSTLEGGAKAVILFGPPRTGKTRVVDHVLRRKRGERIQIHNGWGYSELVLGLRPTGEGGWAYQAGPLLAAIRSKVDYVLLEEINRTDFSQAIGEVFLLIEDAYRGDGHSVRLQDGSKLSIPKDMLFLFTMNTLDRSTEAIDDALFGRMAAIEFPPRVEILSEMLEGAGIANAGRWREIFALVQQFHPMGHGYFATLTGSSDPITFYRTRLRPVLQKHLAGYRDDDLATIDEKFNELFAR
jgi:5-methylcytosine-specific restriction protein B